MTRDKEVQLGEIGNLSVDDDAPRRRASASSGGSAGPRKAPQPGKPPAPKRATPKSSNGIWMAATGLLTILVIVLGAYFFKQVSTMQARLDNQFGQSSEELEKIASQLSATDESLNQSSGKLSETLVTHGSEIRKLWDVSNKRNKSWIQKNQADIDKLGKQRAATDKALASLKTEIATLKTQNQQYALQRNQMQTQIDLATEAVRQAEAQVAAQKKTIDQFSAMLPALKSLAAAQAKGEGLDVRLVDVEAAISAFDTYRRQVNSRLDGLEAAPR